MIELFEPTKRFMGLFSSVASFLFDSDMWRFLGASSKSVDVSLVLCPLNYLWGHVSLVKTLMSFRAYLRQQRFLLNRPVVALFDSRKFPEMVRTSHKADPERCSGLRPDPSRLSGYVVTSELTNSETLSAFTWNAPREHKVARFRLLVWLGEPMAQHNQVNDEEQLTRERLMFSRDA